MMFRVLNTLGRLALLCLLMDFFWGSLVKAEVDKIYHPYVEYDTYEFEARIIDQHNDGSASDFSLYRLGIGKDVAEEFFLEIYFIGEKNSSDNIDVEAYEIEALYQIGEQGEYWADFGIIAEIEKESETSEWEGSFGLLVEKEFGRWSGALNLHSQYVYEDDKRHEWSSNIGLQIRHRYQSVFEYGIELYGDKNSLAAGPVFLGQIRFFQSKLNWEIGFMKEIKDDGTNRVVRALLEYEF